MAEGLGKYIYFKKFVDTLFILSLYPLCIHTHSESIPIYNLLLSFKHNTHLQQDNFYTQIVLFIQILSFDCKI